MRLTVASEPALEAMPPVIARNGVSKLWQITSCRITKLARLVMAQFRRLFDLFLEDSRLEALTMLLKAQWKHRTLSMFRWVPLSCLAGILGLLLFVSITQSRSAKSQLEGLLLECRQLALMNPEQGTELQMSLTGIEWSKMFVFTPYFDPKTLATAGNWEGYGEIISEASGSEQYCCLVFSKDHEVVLACDVDRGVVDFSDAEVPSGGVERERALFQISLRRESSEFTRVSATLKK